MALLLQLFSYHFEPERTLHFNGTVFDYQLNLWVWAVHSQRQLAGKASHARLSSKGLAVPAVKHFASSLGCPSWCRCARMLGQSLACDSWVARALAAC